MYWRRTLLLLSLIALGTLLARALAQPPSAVKPAAPPAKAAPPKADPAAEAAVDEAMKTVDPKKVGWLKMKLWQQLDVQGLKFQTHGEYLAGGNQRLKLNLRLQAGGTDGTLLVVSDGKTLWEETRVGNQPPTVMKVGLSRVLDVLSAPNLIQRREEFLQSESFAGLLPLLQSLRKQVVFTKVQDLTWRGREVLLLTGVWQSAPSYEGKQWPDGLPRECKLYLDKQTHWPHRLEWLGPSAGRSEDALLMEMEFRDPQYLTNEQVSPKEFVYDPGASEVTDRTETYEARAKQFARLPVARP